MRLAPDELARLLELRERRDHAAYIIGVATAEWRQHVKKAEAIIAESEAMERDMGPQLLRLHGLDPGVNEYRIENDGRITKLVAGQYAEVVG